MTGCEVEQEHANHPVPESPAAGVEVPTSGNATQAQGESQAPDDEADIRSTDQRAATLTAVAALAASLALSGAAIIVDTEKMTSPAWIRGFFGVPLVLAVLLFTLAAVVAVTCHQMPRAGGQAPTTSKKKHARVNTSMWLLCGGMACVLLVTAAATLAGMWGH
jgi:hypothetical protein